MKDQEKETRYTVPVISGWLNEKTGEILKAYDQLPHPDFKPLYLSPPPEEQKVKDGFEQDMAFLFTGLGSEITRYKMYQDNWEGLIQSFNELQNTFKSEYLKHTQKQKEWISVEEEKPKGRFVPCLVFNGDAPEYNQHVFISHWYDQEKNFRSHSTGNFMGTITHWKKLIEPPKAPEKEDNDEDIRI